MGPSEHRAPPCPTVPRGTVGSRDLTVPRAPLSRGARSRSRTGSGVSNRNAVSVPQIGGEDR